MIEDGEWVTSATIEFPGRGMPKAMVLPALKALAEELARGVYGSPGDGSLRGQWTEAARTPVPGPGAPIAPRGAQPGRRWQGAGVTMFIAGATWGLAIGTLLGRAMR